jgi:RNase P subunit RPR2
MPRDGSVTPADLVGKLDWLVVSCEKCGRLGRYNVARLVKELSPNLGDGRDQAAAA